MQDGSLADSVDNEGDDEEGLDSMSTSDYCRLKDLQCGQIGTIKKYKSGKAELCLGQYTMPLKHVEQKHSFVNVSRVLIRMLDHRLRFSTR